MKYIEEAYPWQLLNNYGIYQSQHENFIHQLGNEVAPE